VQPGTPSVTLSAASDCGGISLYQSSSAMLSADSHPNLYNDRMHKQLDLVVVEIFAFVGIEIVQRKCARNWAINTGVLFLALCCLVHVAPRTVVCVRENLSGTTQSWR
jgi:cell division protein FtsW (lipid II flippase)